VYYEFNGSNNQYFKTSDETPDGNKKYYVYQETEADFIIGLDGLKFGEKTFVELNSNTVTFLGDSIKCDTISCGNEVNSLSLKVVDKIPTLYHS
jgi:hypothetical protein